MAWFKKSRKPIEAQPEKSSKIPEGLWVKCPACAQVIYNKDLAANLQVCPKCSHHFRLSALERLRHLFDDGEFDEHDAALASVDPLEFTDTKPYRSRLASSRAATGHQDAVVCGSGRRRRHPHRNRGDGVPASSAAAWAWWSARRSRAASNARSRHASRSSSSRVRAARG